ncbi:hypothetical protein [Barrientosiimonas humi]|uniref:hypothetical protein n=1 Tax=Barrientosiimonas humi TaxID=999931 RepID=UPI0011504B24|nr:hypothetical protein [Barrientosiimonas humi]
MASIVVTIQGILAGTTRSRGAILTADAAKRDAEIKLLLGCAPEETAVTPRFVAEVAATQMDVTDLILDLLEVIRHRSALTHRRARLVRPRVRRLRLQLRVLSPAGAMH